MALTNYLAQSVIGLTLFYGIGMGLGSHYGMVGVVLAWTSVIALQISWSRWWLERFAYGPVEWLWRWLTCGSCPRLSREAAEGASPQNAA